MGYYNNMPRTSFIKLLFVYARTLLIIQMGLNVLLQSRIYIVCRSIYAFYGYYIFYG